jgi:hypothetical protein
VVEANARVLLGRALDETLSYLERAHNDGARYRPHYVTAREVYSTVRAAEARCSGDPSRFRRWVDVPIEGGGAIVAEGFGREHDQAGRLCDAVVGGGR